VSGYAIGRLIGRVHNSGKRLCSLLDRVIGYTNCSLSTLYHGRSINLAAAVVETLEIWLGPILYLNVY
jgi:hypothetical protein